MPEIRSDGVRISYDLVGEGRPLLLLHGWGVDRTSWTSQGYVDELESDFRLVSIDIRGRGASDKPHDAAAYASHVLAADVLAVADAEGLDRFAIWGQSSGGWMAWMTAAAAPARVSAIVTSGAWDPRPVVGGLGETYPQIIQVLQQGGTRALIDLMRSEDGDRFESEFPPWAQAIVLRADPEALVAAWTIMWADGISDLGSFSVPALLIAGELEDESDDAATIAATIPNGQRLRLPGLGHEGTCNASAMSLPTARAFLDGWLTS
jgi:pimeloyl-ACP methyl ester carboxylesterase